MHSFTLHDGNRDPVLLVKSQQVRVPPCHQDHAPSVEVGECTTKSVCTLLPVNAVLVTRANLEDGARHLGSSNATAKVAHDQCDALLLCPGCSLVDCHGGERCSLLCAETRKECGRRLVRCDEWHRFPVPVLAQSVQFDNRVLHVGDDLKRLVVVTSTGAREDALVVAFVAEGSLMTSPNGLGYEILHLTGRVDGAGGQGRFNDLSIAVGHRFSPFV